MAIEAGMIGALFDPTGSAAPTKLATGDTLCDPRAPILLDTIVVPNAVMGGQARRSQRPVP